MNGAFQQMKVDFRSGVPIYLQIVDQVQKMVVNGELKHGDQLPTVRHLAAELRVNFNTVARAYRILDEARIISTQRGRGTYIWEEPDENTIQHLRQINLAELSSQALKKMIEMGFTPDEIRDAMQKAMDAKTVSPETETTTWYEEK